MIILISQSGYKSINIEAELILWSQLKLFYTLTLGGKH